MKILRLLSILVALFVLGLHENARGQCNASFTAVQNGTSIDITNTSTLSSGTIQWDIWNYTTGNLVYSDTNTSGFFNIPVSQAGGHNISIFLTCGDSGWASVNVNCSSNPINLNPQVTNATCNGNCDGMIALNPTGGYNSGYYMDNWSNLGGGSGGTFTNPNLCAGMYSVTISDSFGCEAVGNYTITEGSFALMPASDTFSFNCLPNTITISPSLSGGSAPFSYTWSDGSTGTSLAVTTGGVYQLTVTDANGCSAYGYYPVSDSATFSAYAYSTADAGYGTCLGSAQAVPNLGTAPYSYSWSNGDTTSSINGLCAGSYTVTITDANGCTGSFTATIVAEVCYKAIGGSVSPNTTSKVYLIQESNGFLTAVDSMVADSGYYMFLNLCAGTYYLKAALMPASPDYSNYIPTYYQSASLWSNATAIVLVNYAFGTQINMHQGTNTGGPGFIGGLISNGANREGSPMRGVMVILKDENENPVQFSITDGNGKYGFEDIALGNYTVWVDQLNIIAVPYAVSLTTENPTAENRDFEIAGGKAMPVEAVGIAELNPGFYMFPNPVEDLLYIRTHEQVENVTVTNMAGVTVETASVLDNKGAEVSVKILQPGFYILNVTMDNGATRQKPFIKQ